MTVAMRAEIDAGIGRPSEQRMMNAFTIMQRLGHEIASQIDDNWLAEAITDSVRVMEAVMFAVAIRLPEVVGEPHRPLVSVDGSGCRVELEPGLVMTFADNAEALQWLQDAAAEVIAAW